MPDKANKYSEEGTLAHEVLEAMLLQELEPWDGRKIPVEASSSMRRHARNAADFILGKLAKTPGAEGIVETKVFLDWIDPEMFGTFDSAIIEHFGRLHVFDFKFGKKLVSPIKNLQMIFYALGLAKKFDWNFDDVRVWIIQPRAPGYSGPTFWDIPMRELREYWQAKFVEAVERVRKNPNEYVEGAHCHWCKAKSKCPMKNEKRVEQAKAIFKPVARREVAPLEEIEF